MAEFQAQSLIELPHIPQNKVNKTINYFPLFNEDDVEKEDDDNGDMDELKKHVQGISLKLQSVVDFNELTAMSYSYSTLRDKVQSWQRFFVKHNILIRLLLFSFAVMIYLNSDSDGIFGYLQNEETANILEQVVFWISVTIFGILIFSNVYYIIYWHIVLSRIGQKCNICCSSMPCWPWTRCIAKILTLIEGLCGKIQSSVRLETVCLLSMVLGVMNPTVHLALMIGIFMLCDIVLSSVYGARFVLDVGIEYSNDKQRQLYEMEKIGIAFIFDESYDTLKTEKSILFKLLDKHFNQDGHTIDALVNWDLFLQSRFLLYYTFIMYLIKAKRVFNVSRYLTIITTLTPQGMYMEFRQFIKHEAKKSKYCHYLYGRLQRGDFLSLVSKMSDIIKATNDDVEDLPYAKLQRYGYSALVLLYQNVYMLISGMYNTAYIYVDFLVSSNMVC